MPNEPKNLKMFHDASPDAFEKVRALRKSMTEAESILWQALRGRKVEGWKFRRQHPFKEYILDFYCNQIKLAVEVDGDYHLKEEQREYDRNRTNYLIEQGLKVIRFTNTEVMTDIENVIKKIKEFNK